MKLTASRLKELILEELNSIREGMDPLSKMAADPEYRPIDDVGEMSPPAVNPHQAEHDRKMKEDPSYREWFMSQAHNHAHGAEDVSDFSQRLKDIGAI